MLTEVNSLSSSTMTATTATIRPQNVENVKLKFFNSIGLDTTSLNPSKRDLTCLSPCYGGSNSTSDTSAWDQRIQKVATFQEELKYNALEDRRYARSTSFTTSASDTKEENVKQKKKQNKCLSFDEKVEVVPIPMRNEYSNRVKERLWSNALEIQENAARNSLEFAHEGWDWRNVLEDEHMYVCVATAELIHPCHYEMFTIHGFR